MIPRSPARYLLFALLFISKSSFASHIVGLELFYTNTGGNNYTITLNVYGDCGPLSAAAFATLPTATPTVCIYDGNTSVSSITLGIQAPANGVEVTPVCPADSNLTQCTNTSFAIPGIKKFVYTGTFTMPYRSSTWRFIFTGSMGATSLAGRAAAITNISAGTTIEIEDTLNNSTQDNSNAIMTTVPTPFFCVNNNDSYTPGAVDPDGDSLSFSLIPGINGTAACSPLGSPVAYISPFSGSNPLEVVPGSFSLDQHTGQVSFLPSILQRALVVYNVEEYRHGVFVGSSQREMTFLVITCTDIPPVGSFTNTSAGTIGDSTHFYICSDSGAFNLYVTPKEDDTSNLVTITGSGLPAGATYQVNNDSTNHPQFVLHWTTTGTPTGTYIYYLTYKDNACPLSGTLTQAFSIIITPQPTVHAIGGFLDCTGNPTWLSATGATKYAWGPTTGLPCATCDSNQVRGLAGTITYTVTGTDNYGCTNTDTATIVVRQSFNNFLHDITPSQVVAYGSSIQLNAQGATYYYWKPDDGTLSNANINNPIAKPYQSTTYTLFAYNTTGCIDSAQVTINVSTSKEVIPNAFTPNGDDVNDFFKVSNLGYGHLVDMRIFNRWGQLIYQTSDNVKGWDGTFGGKPQDAGTYTYSIIIEHEDNSMAYYKGDLTLIR